MKNSDSPIDFPPSGWHCVTPRILVNDSKELVEFLEYVFGATGEYRHDAPTEVRIGDSIILVSEADVRIPMVAFLYVYVRDVDDTYRRAVEAGVCVIEEPCDLPYGDRRCMVEDRWGNTWQIATRLPLQRLP